MKKLKFILIIMFSGVLFISCDSTTTQDLSPVVTNPTYTANVAPVISTNCVSCHSGGNQFPDLDSYANVKAAIDGTNTNTLLCRLDGTCGAIMPQSGALPNSTVTMIKLWAQQGFVN